MDVTITRLNQGGAGEYQAHVAGSDAIGRLTWIQHGEVRAAEHTLVPPSIGGRGVAGKLVAALIEDARAEGFKIKAVCSYVAAAFEKHPDWADLQA